MSGVCMAGAQDAPDQEKVVVPDASEPNPDDPGPELPPQEVMPESGPEATPEPKPEPICQEGDTRPCYTGPAATRGKGTCKDGLETCTNNQWTACVGDTTPAAKDTCGDQRDNNCNGVIDEMCPCQYLNKPHGVCKSAQTDAQGKCQAPATYAEKDDCNDQLDNNCDGNINEGCECTSNETRDCGIDVGECKKGTQKCVEGKWSTTCDGEKKPAASDSCGDGKDNDCDGAIDEFCACRYLGKDKGVCKDAKNDAQGKCQEPTAYNAAERCGDKLDNDCDGVVDEGCPCIYRNKPHGICKTARIGGNGQCQRPSLYDDKERCGDQHDNNCDGFVDEGCPCNYLNRNKGVCVNLKRDAQGVCPKPPFYNDTELCDGKDNNCDGMLDRFPIGSQCITVASGCSTCCVSPGGPRDVCIYSTPYCSGADLYCRPSSGNRCNAYKSKLVPCGAGRRCDACNNAVPGGGFQCAKIENIDYCMRVTPTNDTP